MRTNRTIKLVEHEIDKIKARIKVTEDIGIFKHEDCDETLRNLEEVKEVLKLALGGGF